MVNKTFQLYVFNMCLSAVGLSDAGLCDACIMRMCGLSDVGSSDADESDTKSFFVTCRNTPVTANPFADFAASANVENSSVFQWTKCNWKPENQWLQDEYRK